MHMYITQYDSIVSLLMNPRRRPCTSPTVQLARFVMMEEQLVSRNGYEPAHNHIGNSSVPEVRYVCTNLYGTQFRFTYSWRDL